MEPEESATCPYPEPYQVSSCPHIPLSEDPSKYYPPIYAWTFQVVSFLQVSLPKPCVYLSFPLYVLHAPPVSFSKAFRTYLDFCGIRNLTNCVCKSPPLFFGPNPD